MDRICIIVTLFKSKSTIDYMLKNANDFTNNASQFKPVFTFVEDRCPENSLDYLLSQIEKYPHIEFNYYRLSKNFGAPKAMKCGFQQAEGDYYTTIGSDLQEGLDSIEKAYLALKEERSDVCFGVRKSRNDPFISKIYSSIYWFFYRKLIIPENPSRGR